MMSHDPENLFNEELAQLLESLEDSDEQSPQEDSMEDLMSLFGDDFQETADAQIQKSKPERITLSSLPSDAEIEDLFQDGNLSWDDDNSLVSENAEAPKAHQSDDEDWQELENLLSQESESSAFVTGQMPVFEEVPSTLNPVFYESLEELEALIAPSPQGNDRLFAELEELIETIPAHVPTAVEIPVTLPMVAEEPLEDAFQELEKFLQETNQVMGGSPSTSTEGSQRIQRTSKTFEQTMRVPIKQLDNLSNLIGELVVKRNRLKEDQDKLHGFLDNLLNQVQNLSDLGGRIQDLYERTLLERSLLSSRRRSRGITDEGNDYNFRGNEQAPNNSAIAQSFDFEELDRFSDLDPLTVEMMELIVRVGEAASDIQFVVDETDQVARSLQQVTTQLQEGMTKSRMTPFGETTDRLPRAIREVSQKLHKEVQLKVDGRDVLIDKMILENLNSPMTHLVNNAITHGIESPAERQRAGKSPLGTISVRTFLQGNQTVIIVSDDGAGIDAEIVKTKAIEKRLITPEEATVMTKQEVYELLFYPGFSTKDKADDFSGRGVGLDVVRTSLAELRGNAIIDSVVGKGTTFTIRLPLTLSI
ncbi:MAG: hypothetical protein RLZZ148_1762, partial [Cyanobacteriota bacterium]